MRQRFLQYTALLLAWLGASASLVHGQAEREQAPAAALHWVRLPGTYGCLDGSTLARAVEAKLQRKVFAPVSESSVLIEGYVERDPTGYRAELRMTSGAGALLGTRTLRSAATECRELSETVAVVLAIMVDPDAPVVKPPSDPPSAAVEPAPVAAVTLEKAAPAATVHEAEQRLLTFARASVKLMPGAGIGVGAAYERSLPGWGGLRAEGVGFLEARAELDDGSGAGVRLRLAHVGLGYCPLWVGGRLLSFVGCMGVELGLRHSEGFGFEPNNRSAAALWASATARVGVAVRALSVLLFHAGAGFFVPFAPELYRGVRADGVVVPVYRQPALGAVFDVGLGVRF